MDEFLYFFIYYPRNKKEISTYNKFIIPENENERPKCIYSSQIESNNYYLYKKIYKTKKSNSKDIYYFELQEGEMKYII